MNLETLYFIPNIRIMVKTGRNITVKHLNVGYLHVLLSWKLTSCKGYSWGLCHGGMELFSFWYCLCKNTYQENISLNSKFWRGTCGILELLRKLEFSGFNINYLFYTLKYCKIWPVNYCEFFQFLYSKKNKRHESNIHK
jgi:hypothetical protein